MNGVNIQVMELMVGGSLKHWIKKRTQNNLPIEEFEIRSIIKQVLEGLDHMHNLKNCWHRDLKPDNILLKNTDSVFCVKIADFGLSMITSLQGWPIPAGFVGTPTYMAPEILDDKDYTEQVDMWAVGIILYNLLFQGKHPWYTPGDNEKTLIKKMREKQIDFYSLKCPKFAQDLLRNLLERDPMERYSAEQALTHPWITDRSFRNIQYNTFTNYQIFQAGEDIKRCLIYASFITSLMKGIPNMRKPRRASIKRNSRRYSINKSGFMNSSIDSQRRSSKFAQKESENKDMYRLLLKATRNGFNLDQGDKKAGFKRYMGNTHNSLRNSNRDKYIPNLKLPKIDKNLSITNDLDESVNSRVSIHNNLTQEKETIPTYSASIERPAKVNYGYLINGQPRC